VRLNNGSDGRPVVALEFARLMQIFGAFEARPTLAVAVSGGRDSMALTLLAQDWVRERDGTVLALIVDHGLRADSAREAAETQARLASHGAPANILRWTENKPSSGLQEAARAARYRLLFEACRAHGILHLLVAHHADDQAETIAMRAGRGSGPDGLAGMAALVEHRHARLLRPLLALPRARLTATLLAREVLWTDDPSNTDPRFERARLRAAGMSAPATPSGRKLRAEREKRLAEASVETLEFDAGEAVAIDQGRFAGLDAELGAGLLSRVVRGVGGIGYPPRRERLERAVARLCIPAGPGKSGGKSGRSEDFTLAACRLALRRRSDDRRMRWIVRSENGKNLCQPLVPAAFFACGALTAPHLD
jgi:tRNA(Ile)-lysidine synthase